jgi:hypothetical protein
MTQNRVLNYGDALPEMFVDQSQEFISTYLSPNFRVSLVNATTLQVSAGSGNSQVCAAVGGAWRYITSNITAADPGGAAATHTLWLTASANSFTAGPPEVDATTYAFAMEIRASGTPATALSRQIGTVEWDGAAITRVVLDPFIRAEWQDFTGGTAAATFLQGRVRADTQPRIIIRADGRILIGGGSGAQDVNLYRNAADDLRTDDSFSVRGDTAAAQRFVDLYEPASTAGYFRSFASGDTQPRARLGLTSGGAGILEAGAGGASTPDVNLYRSAADTWSTDDSLRIRGDVAGAARFSEVVAPNATTLATHRTLVSGDTVARLESGVDAAGIGYVGFGPGGAAAVDTWFKRSGPGALQLTSSLTAGVLAATSSMTAPTAAVDANTQDVATTAWYTGQASATTPVQVDDTAGAVGTSKRFARADHRHQLAPGIYDTAGNASRLNPMRLFAIFEGMGGDLDGFGLNGHELRLDCGTGWIDQTEPAVNCVVPWDSDGLRAIGGTLQWRWYFMFNVNAAASGGTTFNARYTHVNNAGGGSALTAVTGAISISFGTTTGAKVVDTGWQTAPSSALGDGLIIPQIRFDKSGTNFGWLRSQVIIDVRNV